MKVKPVLGDWEIPNIAFIRSAEQRQLVELPVPGKTGSLLQDMASSPTRIAIGGSLYGDDKRDEFLEKVRGQFKEGKPLTFVADIVTATEVQYVVIQTLRFEESGTSPNQTSFYIELAESPPPPPPSDPLGGLDASLLDEAGGFLDSVTGALDAIDALGSIPELKDPTPPLKGTLDGVKSALDGLGGIQDKLTALFGPGA